MRSVTTSRMPLVTVLMSVYNGERYLRQSIESILNQTFADFEFIIINDGSNDSSHEIIKSYDDPRIRLIDNPNNVGLTNCLNLGLSLARGSYVARQDADDVSACTRFEKQVAFMNAHKEVAILGTRVWIINGRGSIQTSTLWDYSCNEVGIRWLCMFESPFAHSSVMMRRQIVRDSCGGYDSNYSTNQDHELWSRIVFAHPCANLPERLVYLRSHSGSLSANYRRDQMENVATTLRNAIFAALKSEPNSEWIDQWIRINNPNLNQFKGGIRQVSCKGEIRQVVAAIDEMHKRFVLVNNVNPEASDIATHKHRLLLRVAYLSANYDPFTSFAVFWRLCRTRPVGIRAIMPKYLATLLLGYKARAIYRRRKAL